MKAKTFENLIRKIVREEIDYALRREIKSLKEDLQEKTRPSLIEQPINTSLQDPIKDSLKEKIMGKPLTKNKPKTQFSKNSTLNDLLNETAQGDTNMETGGPPASLSQPFATGAPLPENTQGIPDPVAKAMTRD